MNDYETALRHNLSFKLVINDEGRLINVPQEYMVIIRLISRFQAIYNNFI